VSQATESPVHVDAIPSRSVVSRVPDVADTRRRVVLLGGSFDPVHAGHLAMAHAALDQLEADEVWFIPARQAPLKSRQLTPGEHRKAMLEIALKHEPQMRVETCELEREGESFTIDTVRYLKKQYPDCDFTFLVGNDQVEQFHKWKEADALARLVKFAAVARDGRNVKTKYPIHFIHMDPVPVSSTEIRTGNRLNYVPQELLDYFYANRLYCKDFVKSRVPDRRYMHSLSVARLTEEFALAAGLDGQQAWLTGLFHDVCKAMPVDRMRPWLEAVCPEELTMHPAAWHSYVGAQVTDRVFGIHDPRISNAIFHHVKGTSDDPLAMCVFCADKLDPLRGYDSYDLIDLCRRDLKAGFEKCRASNQEYVDAHRKDAVWTN